MKKDTLLLIIIVIAVGIAVIYFIKNRQNYEHFSVGYDPSVKSSTGIIGPIVGNCPTCV